MLKKMPATDRATLTPQMQKNPKNYEDAVRAGRASGLFDQEAIVVFECDRAFSKVYAAKYVVNMSPCLKTTLNYLFAMSTWDLDLPDNQRTIFRWSMPYERLLLQGRDAQLALHMTAKELVHACGNAYPVTVIGACIGPTFAVLLRNKDLWASWPQPDDIDREDVGSLMSPP